MLHQIKASQFYTDLGLQRQCIILLWMVKFKDFSRPFCVFQVLFKANLIFKDFKTVLYIQVLFKPVRTLSFHTLSKYLQGFSNLSEVGARCLLTWEDHQN